MRIKTKKAESRHLTSLTASDTSQIKSKNSKQEIIKYSIILLFNLVIIIILLVLLKYCSDNKLVRQIFSISSSFLLAFIDIIPLYLSYKNTDNQEKSKTVSILQFIVIAVFAMAVLISIIGNVRLNDSNKEESNDTSTSSTNDMLYIEPIKYDFRIITIDETFDLSFSDSPDKTTLFNNLLYSTNSIEYIPTYDDEVLEGDNDYGNNAPIVVYYEAYLDDALENKLIRGDEITQQICQFVIDKSEIMDKEYKTSTNRKRIVKYTRVSYNNNFAEDKSDMQNKCIRYAWGVLYIEIANDNYNKESIETLIELYRESNINRSSTIINSLEMLEEEYSANPPHPNKNAK